MDGLMTIVFGIAIAVRPVPEWHLPTVSRTGFGKSKTAVLPVPSGNTRVRGGLWQLTGLQLSLGISRITVVSTN